MVVFNITSESANLLVMISVSYTGTHTGTHLSELQE